MPKKINIKRLAGWLVFAISFIVYFFSVERTGSLWDCGEFILAAYKLQVVHPPGASLFIIVGRMFTFVAELISNDPSDIAYAVNLMSAICTSFAAAFITWVTFILSKMTLVGHGGTLDRNQTIITTSAAVIAGLTTAFCSSIWFSAVEGEVYAMSTFFTALTLWSVIEWYNLPDNHIHDRWLVFAIFAAFLSIGVHLLSLLTFPALALLFYFKKFRKINLKGALIAMGGGVLFIVLTQKLIIVGIPILWYAFDRLFVNGFGLPVNSGIIPTVILIAALIYFGLRYAKRKQNGYLQIAFVSLALAVIGFSTLGVVVIRANAHPPINMNSPTDPSRLIPYLNREQYGERALVYGPHYNAEPVGYDQEKRYGIVDGKYAVVDYKTSPRYRKDDKLFFPRMGHSDQNRKRLYRQFLGGKRGDPNFVDNISFFFGYQIKWMYWRYFMWNFSGRQNGHQGMMPRKWNVADGNWYSGITFLDEARLHEESELPQEMRNEQQRNRYYMLPFLFGLLGLIYHYRTRRREFLGLFTLFIITGIGIIVYSNQPPQEPRERDYVLAGSFFTYAIWVGMGALALFDILSKRLPDRKQLAAILASALILVAPVIMAVENFDDHSRRFHTGARDYASNFLESCEDNAIIFTYGDNDTYPLWYAQEVEGIRTDVRVINMSLIAVDWYINHQRRRLNDSPPVKFRIPEEAYRGYKRNQLFFFTERDNIAEMSAQQALKFAGERHPLPASSRTMESYIPTKNIFIPVNKPRALETGWVGPEDANRMVSRIEFDFGNRSFITKDDLAIIDIIGSNLQDRPIYFATTVQPSKMQGLADYMQLEGLAMRIIPVKTPSNPNLYIFGSGRVDPDEVYDNVMNKFRWGNFDKKRLYVDESYAATQQAHRMVMMRTGLEMSARGDHKRAADLAKKYLESFPHYNFKYDATVVEFIRILIQAGEMEEAKKHLQILADQVEDRMEFYISLDEEDLRRGFQQDLNYDRSALTTALRFAGQVNDPEFQKKIEAQLQPLQMANIKG